MPKYLKLKVTKIGKYRPTSYEHSKGNASELHIPLICSDVQHGNKKVVIQVYGIDARVWVATNPYKIDISPISELITKIEKNGKSYNEGYELWRIHAEYPFQIPTIRDFFKNINIDQGTEKTKSDHGFKNNWTGLGDIPYERGFPLHYGMKSRYILIKELSGSMDISDIIMVE